MSNASAPSLLPAPPWLRILRHPGVRLLLLGFVLFYTLGFSNHFMAAQAGSPLATIAVAVGMVALGLAIYAGFVRWVEGRPVTELALSPAACGWASASMCRGTTPSRQSSPASSPAARPRRG